MINRLRIEKLFNIFDYDIDLSNDLVILTAPNGYGKSNILKIIDAINTVNLDYLFEVDFEKILIEFKSKGQVKIVKSNKDLIINGYSLRKEIYDDRKIIHKKLHKNYMYEEYIFNKHYSNFKKYIQDGLKDISELREKRKFIYKEDLIDYMEANKEIKSNKKKLLIDSIKHILDNEQEVYFIKEQRLFKNIDKERIINIIDEIPEKLKIIINELSQEYSETANNIDSTYPLRLFKTDDGISEEQYEDKLEELTAKFQKLKDYNLLEGNIDIRVKFKQEHSKALKVYFEDFDKKYRVYEEYIEKFDLFRDIINSKLSFKKVKISKEDGLTVLDNRNNKIDLNLLSSGEKQEIVLYYNLIFELKDNSILLIDEPEISLHITWQKIFMDNLMKALGNRNIKTIIATHSPQILSGYWESQIDLGELYSGN